MSKWYEGDVVHRSRCPECNGSILISLRGTQQRICPDWRRHESQQALTFHWKVKEGETDIDGLSPKQINTVK